MIELLEMFFWEMTPKPPKKMILVIWVFPKIGVPQNGWFIMENPIRWMIWGYPYSRKHPYDTSRCLNHKNINSINASPKKHHSFQAVSAFVPHPSSPGVVSHLPSCLRRRRRRVDVSPEPATANAARSVATTKPSARYGGNLRLAEVNQRPRLPPPTTRRLTT